MLVWRNCLSGCVKIKEKKALLLKCKCSYQSNYSNIANLINNQTQATSVSWKNGISLLLGIPRHTVGWFARQHLKRWFSTKLSQTET